MKGGKIVVASILALLALGTMAGVVGTFYN